MRAPFAFLAALSFAVASSAFAADGAAIYQDKCSACHETDGSGMPGMAPPLQSALWKKLGAKSPAYFAAMVLNGSAGASIDGETYAGAMPTWSAQLSDEDIAAVGSYVLHDFNASTQVVTPADVAAVRAEGHVDAAKLQAMRGGGAP